MPLVPIALPEYKFPRNWEKVQRPDGRKFFMLGQCDCCCPCPHQAHYQISGLTLPSGTNILQGKSCLSTYVGAMDIDPVGGHCCGWAACLQSAHASMGACGDGGLAFYSTHPQLFLTRPTTAFPAVGGTWVLVLYDTTEACLRYSGVPCAYGIYKAPKNTWSCSGFNVMTHITESIGDCGGVVGLVPPSTPATLNVFGTATDCSSFH